MATERTVATPRAILLLFFLSMAPCEFGSWAGIKLGGGRYTRGSSEGFSWAVGLNQPQDFASPA